MKLPEPPPSFDDVYKEAQSLFGNAAVFGLLSHASKQHYLYWDKIKYMERPPDVSAETLWAAVKVDRSLSARPLPFFRDPSGKPFSYAMMPWLERALFEIDRNAPKKIETAQPPTPEMQRRFMVGSLMEEAISSSLLEGAATTREQAKEMLSTNRPPKDIGEKMVLNNYRTMQRLKKDKDRPLSADLLLDWHRTLTEETLDDPSAAGRFRRADEAVEVMDEADHTILYVPPPADVLPARLQALLRFANGEDGGEFIHPIVKAMALHFWLAYEHPFKDGNGRTARALFYWTLLRDGYWIFEWITISTALRRAPKDYAKAFLYTERDGNDLTYFFQHQVDVIGEALEGLHDHLRRKQDELAASAALSRSRLSLNERQREVLAESLRNPGRVHVIEELKARYGVVYQTARTDLQGLVDRGLFQSVRRGKRLFFFPSDRMTEILSEEKK